MTRSFSLRSAWAAATRGGRRRVGPSRRLILLYHRVAAPRDDPFALAVPPERFAEHLAVLGARCRLVGLDEILDRDAADDVPLASITFDDGYADNLTEASPRLCDAGIPATFFVCTGSLGDRRGFWWDRVASAIAATDAPTVDVGGLEGVQAVDALTGPGARTRATLAIAAQLRPLPPATRDALVDALESRLPVRPGGRRETCPVLDDAGLRALAAQPRTVLGAHTRGHPMLSRLSPDEQHAEIVASAEKIRDVTGTSPSLFAYPYGSLDDYDDDSCRAAAAAGMTAAFGNHGGAFDPEHQPYRVPRHYVPSLPAEAFRSWLDEHLAR